MTLPCVAFPACFDWVLGHMELMEKKLATEGSSHPCIGSELELQISGKVVRGVIRGWKGRKHKEQQKHSGPKHTTGSLKNPTCKTKAVEKKLDKNNDTGC
jgi:hypothetical protein